MRGKTRRVAALTLQERERGDDGQLTGRGTGPQSSQSWTFSDKQNRKTLKYNARDNKGLERDPCSPGGTTAADSDDETKKAKHFNETQDRSNRIFFKFCQ